MSKIQSYKDLIVWSKSVQLSINLVNTLPKSFVQQGSLSPLYSQIIKSSISVASNIAEGYTRSGKLDKLKFLNYSISSCAELETQLIILQNCSQINLDDSQKQLLEVIKILYSLVKRIKQFD